MSTRPDPSAGFSLVELVIALAIGSVVLSALMIVTSFASSRQMGIVRDVTLARDGVLSIEALRGSLRGASFIVSPAAGSQSDLLSGVVNADPTADFAPIIAGRPREYFYFCMDPGPPRKLYRYAGPIGPTNAVVPAITCGEAGGLELAGDPRLSPVFHFSRAVDSSNLITIDYALSYSSSATASPQVHQGRTAIQTQAPL
jgi:prepilin-type N-terminal cleavage/methylation domain-containing protein